MPSLGKCTVFLSFDSTPVLGLLPLGNPPRGWLVRVAISALGLLGLAMGQRPAGPALRRLLPVILVLFLLTEGVKELGVRLGLVGERFAAALVSAAYLLMMAGLVTWNARHLARAEAARQQADEERRRSEHRFQTIFEQAPMGIGLIDSVTGHICEVNAKYEKIVGITRDVLATLDWMRITHPEDIQKDLDQMAQLNAGEIDGFQMDKRLLRQDGREVWIRMTIVPIQVGHDLSRRHLAMFEDITERLQSEEERQRLQTQLVQAQKMDSLGGLAGGVAHDMNNVLGAILGLASANLETQDPGSEIRRALNTIIKAAERGGKMVKRLLSFARQAPAEEHELNLNETLQEVVRLLERTTLARVRLELDLANDLKPTRGDAGALAHAFMNLCVNALDAMPEHGTLTLRTRNVEPGMIEIQVEDTGAGMSNEVLEQCLDPFFTTKEVGKGTGLGLSLVYSTVKAHHGQLEIQSQSGQGTRVKMRFPASEPVSQAGESAQRTVPESWARGLRVLVIDDDQLMRCALEGLLKVLGHTATIAGCGEDALALLEAGLEVDAVILDMNMPGLGGSGTLPRLRSLRPALPVLLATGRVDQAALDLVGSDPKTVLLPKPFSLVELGTKLAALARPRDGPLE
jgi:PAS domain S-box-containing protein